MGNGHSRGASEDDIRWQQMTYDDRKKCLKELYPKIPTELEATPKYLYLTPKVTEKTQSTL